MRQEHTINSTLLVALFTAAIMVVVTAVQMLGPLLLDMATEFNTSIAVIGQLTAAGGLIWAIGGPLSGTLSDRYGRKPLMTLGHVVFGVLTLAASWANDLPLLFILRMMGCAGGALITTNLLAGIAEYVPAEKRGRALGWIMSGFSIAAMLAVPAVAIVADVGGWRWSFRVVGILILLMGVAVHKVLPYVPPQRTNGARSAFGSLLRSSSVVGLLACNVFERLTFGAVATYLAAFLMQTYSLSAGQVAPVISAAAVATMVGSVVGGRLAERANRVLLIVVAQTLAGIFVVPLTALTPGVVVSGLLAALFSTANAISRPAFMCMVSDASPTMRGAMMGLTVTTNQAGLMLGAALGGLAIAFGGYQALGLVVLGACLLSALSCRRMVRPEKLATIGV